VFKKGHRQGVGEGQESGGGPKFTDDRWMSLRSTPRHGHGYEQQAGKRRSGGGDDSEKVPEMPQHHIANTTESVPMGCADRRTTPLSAGTRHNGPMARRDLSLLLKDLSVSRRPGRWCMVTNVTVPTEVMVAAMIVENEGVTSVVSVSDAERLGVTPEFVAAWLTLDVNSALDAVGLTAAVSSALAAGGIACNVLAGYHHDHLLVPEDDAARAVSILVGLRPSV